LTKYSPNGNAEWLWNRYAMAIAGETSQHVLMSSLANANILAEVARAIANVTAKTRGSFRLDFGLNVILPSRSM
jgi:hypothetical protein